MERVITVQGGFTLFSLSFAKFRGWEYPKESSLQSIALTKTTVHHISGKMKVQCSCLPIHPTHSNERSSSTDEMPTNPNLSDFTPSNALTVLGESGLD